VTLGYLNTSIRRFLKGLLIKYAQHLSKSASDCHIQNMVSLIPKNADLLLDIGCGAGQLFYANDYSQTVGLDLDRNSLKLARTRLDGLIMADLNKGLPLKSNVVDVIYSDQAIEHLIETDQFAEEVFRILRPTGCAVIGTENLASWHNIFALLVGEQPSSGPYISSKYKIGFHPIWNEVDKKYNCYNGHNKVFTFKALSQFFWLHGFEIEKSLVSGYYPIPGALSRLFMALDSVHSHFMVFKVRKRQQR
jgi:SAM-dependent methyltransferase